MGSQRQTCDGADTIDKVRKERDESKQNRTARKADSYLALGG